MGTMRWPFADKKRTLVFLQRLKKPWLIKVTYDDTDDTYVWDCDIVNYLWDDELLDRINCMADKKKKDFTLNSLVKKYLKDRTEEELSLYRLTGYLDRKSYTLETLNLIRAAVRKTPQALVTVEQGLRKLEKDQSKLGRYLKKQRWLGRLKKLLKTETSTLWGSPVVLR